MRAFEFTKLFEQPEQQQPTVDPAVQKEKMDYIVALMKDNPDFLRKVYTMAKIDKTPPPKLKKGDPESEPTDKINPYNYLKKDKTTPEEDYIPRDIIKEFVKALTDADVVDVDDLEAFLQNYGKYDYIDTEALKTTNKRVSTESILKGEGNVSEQFIKNLYQLLFPIQTKSPTRGPGEIALALLSPRITFAPEGKGDLVIDGTFVEVKGQTSIKGGRLVDSPNDFGNPDPNKVYNQIPDLPDEEKIDLAQFTAAVKARKTHVLDHAQKLEQYQKGAGKAFVDEIIKTSYKYVPELYDELFTNPLSMSKEEFIVAVGKLGFNNYMKVLEKKAGPDGANAFNHVLLLAPTASLYFDKNEIEANIGKTFNISSIDFGDKRNGPAPQISI